MHVVRVTHDGLADVAEHVETLAEAEGLPAHARSVDVAPRERARGGHGTMKPPVAPRDDLRSLEGYHSPQLDVSVRLNTNESPYRAARRVRRAVARRAARRAPQPLSRPRRARAARVAREAPRPTARAPLLRERVERGAADPAAHLRRAGPAGRHVRAHLRVALPHRPDHRHRGGRRRAHAPTSRSTRRRRAR